MKRKPVHSDWTFAWKFLLPFAVALFLNNGMIARRLMKWGVSAVSAESAAPFLWLVVMAFVLWHCWTLTKVEVDDRFLYISNYFRSVKVPFEQVQHVYGTRSTVTVTFIQPTQLGKRIHFLAPSRFFEWSPPPIVEELSRLADQSKKSYATAEPRQ